MTAEPQRRARVGTITCVTERQSYVTFNNFHAAGLVVGQSKRQNTILAADVCLSTMEAAMTRICLFKLYRFFMIHRFWKAGVYMLLGLLIGFYPWLVGQQQDQAVIWSAILVGAFVFGLAWLEPISQWRKIRGIAGKNPGILLVRRMAALDLDPNELRLLDPALMHHMQRQCTVCENREYCLQVLTSGSALQDREDWRDYCPNAFALEMLSGLQRR